MDVEDGVRATEHPEVWEDKGTGECWFLAGWRGSEHPVRLESEFSAIDRPIQVAEERSIELRDIRYTMPIGA